MVYNVKSFILIDPLPICTTTIADETSNPGMVAHTCNPSIQEGKRIASSRPDCAIQQDLVPKIKPAGCSDGVFNPSIQEAEAGRSL